MLFVEAGYTAVASKGCFFLGEAVLSSADEMSEGVAREGVEAQQNGVQEENQGADANAKLHWPFISASICGCEVDALISEPERLNGIFPEEHEENEGGIEEVAVDVLKNQGEPVFSGVFLPGFAHCASGGIGPEGFVVGTSIVVTGEPKERRERED